MTAHRVGISEIGHVHHGTAEIAHRVGISEIGHARQGTAEIARHVGISEIGHARHGTAGTARHVGMGEIGHAHRVTVHPAMAAVREAAREAALADHVRPDAMAKRGWHADYRRAL